MRRSLSANLFLIVLLCLAQAGFSQAPGLQWARALNGAASGTAYPQSINTDAAKNVYTVGSFRNTIDADPGAAVFPLTSSGQDDIFVSKLDVGGNFVWAVRIGGASTDIANAVTVDNTGLIYVTGSYTGTVDFDPGPGTFNLTGGGAFAFRLNSDGTLSWAGRIGSGVGNAIAIDLSNNLVIAGDFTGSSDFDPGPGTTTLTSAGSVDIFVSKFLLDGTLVWARQLGGTAADFSSGLDTDAANNIYTAGSFSGTADFNPGGAVNNLTSAGGSDIYVSKLDAAGAYVLAVRIGGAGSEDANALTVDGTGDVLAAGNFSGTVDFDPGGSVSNLTSAGSSDIFVVKLTSAGAHTWSRNMGGASSDVPSNIAVDAAGGVYTTGYFYGTADFDPGASTFNLIAGTGNQEAFISKLTSAGNFAWASRTESTAAGETEGVAIALDLAEDILIAGWFELVVDFDPGPCTYNLPSNGDDIFIMKLSPASPTCIPTITGFSPASGPVGSTVIISGFQFSPTPANNAVYFGATRANVTVATSTQLTVTVPVGATYQPLSITIGGATVFSKAPFLVSFPGGGLINTCSFETPVFYGNGVAGSAGAGLAIGDLDGDGKTDVVTSDYLDNKIHIFRNTSSTGTINATSFATSIDYTVGTNPIRVAIADIDGDTKLDITVSMYNGNTVSIFRNVSTPGSLTAGSFSARVDLPTNSGSGPLSVVCRDLDGDGRTDIAVGNAAHGTISIWRNIGSLGSITTGSFATRLDIAGPGTAFAIEDIDGDGKPDLVGGYNLSTAIGISRNVSSPGALTASSFQPFVNFTVGAWPEYILIGDLDSDNRPDLVTSSWPGNTISVLKNNSTPGTMNTGSLAPQAVFPGNNEPRGVALSDFDGDGLLDIGLSNQTGVVGVYKNANTPGSITTGSFLTTVLFGSTGNARDIQSGDIDGDGKPELITASFGSQSFSVMRNIVRAAPTISGFSPTTGPVGTTVTITGTNFSTTLSENVVSFNGTAGFVIGATATSLTVVVPSGGTTGVITVTVNCNGPASSAASFTVTPIAYNTCGYVTLNGSTDYINVVRNPSLESASITLEALVNFSATPTTNVIIAKPYQSANQDSYAIWYQGGSLNAGVRLGGGIGAAWTPTLGQWYHVALTYNSISNSEVLYVNGAAIAAGTALPPLYDTQDLLIGADVNSGVHDLFFNGKIDEVRIWNLQRTQVELLTNLTTNLIGNEPGLVAYYRINGSGQGTGIAIPNSASATGATNNGVTVGTAATPTLTGSCALTITSFSPTSGPQGTTVMISGTNFSTTQIGNAVYFGATRATVTAASTTQLTVTVPPGATYKPISVTVGGAVALSSAPFLVTFSSGGTIDPCTYAPRVEFNLTGAISPGGVVLSDFDGDGKDDIAMTLGSTDFLRVFSNGSTIGSPSFASGVDFPVGDFPDGLAVGDLDGDGKPDVAMANANSQNISVLRNTSTPGNISFAAKVDVGTALTNGRRIAISDIDGDGLLDLVIPNSFTKVSVLKNQSLAGTISFASKVDFTMSLSSVTPWDVAATDFDSDGKPDLVVSISSTNKVSVLRNASTVGVIGFDPFVQFTTATGPFDVETGDLDGDSKADIVTVNLAASGSVSVLRNTSTPGVIDPSSFAPKVDFLTSGFPNSAALDDFNGDGKIDIAVGRQNSTLDISVLQNNAVSGTINATSFGSQVIYATGPLAGGNHFIAAGDIDNDGKSDLVLTHLKFSVFLNSTVTSPPTISSFSPILGPVGTTVTITGTNFGNIQSRILVKFNGVPASITSSTDIEIVATVPFNATPGPVTVTVGCNAANAGAGPVDFTVNGDCVTSTERNALVALYNATNGAGWLNNSNWLTADEDTWFGVTVVGCYVTEISLGENNLTGFLPSQIGDLSHLTMLYLKENQIGGNIPSRVGDLANLTILDLGTNAFTSMSNLSASLLDKANLDFNVNHNQMGFGTIEPNMVFDHISYSPQDLVYPGDFIPFIPGQALTIPFSASGTANSYQWFKDGLPIGGPSATGNYVKVGAVAADVGGYAVEVTNTLVPGLTLPGGPFFAAVDPCDGQPRLDGTLDTTFDPDIGSPTQVTAVGVQSTGQVVASVTGSGIVRFNTDGTLDGDFTPSGQLAIPRELVIQPDDKIIVGSPTGHLFRLNEDGTNDNSFNDQFFDNIYGIALQPDGKLIYSAEAESPPLLIRLDINGDDDPSFNAPEDLPAYSIVVQPDGYILMGGPFPGGIARLDPTGALDPSFQGNLNNTVEDIALQEDGKIVVVGHFTDTPLRGLVRLNADGTIDNSFITTGITGLFQGMYPTNVIAQSNGAIIISGQFDAAQGSVRKNLVRLNSDGTVDCSFDPAGSTNSPVLDMGQDPISSILIAGDFTSYDGTTRFGLARLHNNLEGSCLPLIEREALIALYNSTNGAAWTNKTNWLSVDENTWNGITVVDCHVTQINLEENNLVGPLPPEIGNLPQLTHLIISGNKINGTLPSTVTNLTNLEELYLDNNDGISGPLPSTIGNMTSLRIINTQGNAFTGPIPASMANCIALEDIHLEGNQHTGALPVYFSTFSNLYSINLGFNLFSGSIPPEWGDIFSLSFLSLANNNLTGSIPIEFGSLSNLTLMDLSRNQLSGTIPVELGALGALTDLQLWSNQLTGVIPSELGNALNLQHLGLQKNQLSGSIPTSLGDLANLLVLELNENQLTGSIPVELGNDALLQFVRLNINQLTGGIPTELGNLPDLFLLDLDNNQLTGTIPAELGNDASLKSLNLNNNQLSGSIPIELGNLTLLEDLIFYNNQLTGTLPVELGQCVNLKRFGAGDNQLSGTLPVEYGNWTALTDFGIYNNSITGAVPVEYLAWNSIIYLYLSGNQLDAIPVFTSGTILEYNVFDNQLDFGDLEPAFPAPGTFFYDPQADLPGGNFNLNAGTALTIPFTTNGTANQYQWFKNGVLIPGATSATFTIASTTVTDAGSYTVAITNTIATDLTLNSLPFVVSITPVINITAQPADFITCEGATATFTAAAVGTTNIVYQWQFSPNGPAAFVDISNGPNFTGVSTNVLSINTTGFFGVGRYRCRINGDLAAQVITFDEGLFVNALPTAPGTTGNAGCASTAVLLSATGAANGQYRWYTVSAAGSPIVGEVNNTYLTPALSSTTTFYASINNGTCESTRTPVIATIIALPTSPTAVGALGCAPSASLTLNAAGGSAGQYRWYTVATGGSPITGETNSTYLTPALSVNTTFYVSLNNGICESLRVPVNAQIRSCTPTITEISKTTPIGSSLSIDIAILVTVISDPIDLASIKVISQPISGAIAAVTAGVLTINYAGVSFAGTDRLTIEACDLAGHCTQREITIEVVGEITVYNAVSPNGDGKNDTFVIQYIESLPETQKNKVTIFNRWGTVVYEAVDYDNSSKVFKGQSNGGDDLPSGTYFYTLEFSSGEPKRTGFISLRR